ncbi:glycosyltransferase [Sphingosinicella sp. LHD-64]|uniref:glycosyltransferase n=1 Tax=Sphingosinicella sp. LHD-64 TaxID=3072139 RepID=UPI00280DC9D8|nr:glycosyltransferase [Sphingosinicella sp. LHD-64]MDQ8757224.1 glycosyltransferase [Sphingosinicella sp. LHD-64]
MVVLHIITDLTKGGAELKMARLIAAHRDRSDYVHKVISLRTVGPVGVHLLSLGVDVEALGMQRWLRVPVAIVQLRNRIRVIDPDVVQTWMYHADFFGGLAARWAGKRAIIWGVRLADLGPSLGISRLTTGIRHLCARISGIVPARIAYVAEAARQIHERLGYDPEKSVVIHNGYAVHENEKIQAWRRQRRAELGILPETILIGTAGRFSPQKNFHGFVDAAGALARRHPNLHFLLAGRGLVRENEELAAWIARAGVGDRLTLLGERDDLIEWQAAMDIFALFSNGEGMPNVVAEAMSVGIPCVVTDVGDAALLVGNTGVVIQPRDGDALVAALERLAFAGAERRRLAAEARARVLAEFSMNAAVARYESLYKDVVRVN